MILDGKSFQIPTISVNENDLDAIIWAQSQGSPTSVLSCNYYREVFVPHTFGNSGLDRSYLRKIPPVLNEIVRAVLKIVPLGGRFKVCRSGVYLADKRNWNGQDEWVCLFKLSQALT